MWPQINLNSSSFSPKVTRQSPRLIWWIFWAKVSSKSITISNYNPHIVVCKRVHWIYIYRLSVFFVITFINQLNNWSLAEYCRFAIYIYKSFVMFSLSLFGKAVKKLDKWFKLHVPTFPAVTVGLTLEPALWDLPWFFSRMTAQIEMLEHWKLRGKIMSSIF
jgi:hypothetical protein